MNFDRRGFLKFGLFGAGVTAAGLTVPLGSSASTADWTSTLPARDRPVPYAQRIAKTNYLPHRTLEDADGRYRLYTVIERAFNANIANEVPLRCSATPTSTGGPDRQQRARAGHQTSAGHPREAPGEERPAAVPPDVRAREGPLHPLARSASLPQYDGYADDRTFPQRYKDYWYPNHQGARTLWYADHGVHHTAKNAYSGLAAQYHLHDAEEQAKLPQATTCPSRSPTRCSQPTGR